MAARGLGWVIAVAVALGAAPAAIADEGATVVLEEELLVSDAILDRWFREGTALMADRSFLAAAQRFDQVINAADRGNPVAQEAQHQLAVALLRLGLNQSALTRFEPIVDAGQSHPKYRQTLLHLLEIARVTGADASVMLKLASYPPEHYPPEHADELHFLVGQYFFAESSFADALARLQLVSRRDLDFFVRARYLEGVVLIQQSGLGADAREISGERLEQAAEAFRTILRVQRDDRRSATIDRVAEQAILALGRLFYSTRQYDVAVRYYNEVPPSSALWLDSVFEASWVHFQLKNYPRALGDLHTLNSPYFVDQYYPESRVLQALILFYNCKYDEADVIVRDFVQDYFPLMDQLRREINQFADPNAFYMWLATLARAEDPDYSVRFQRIFNAALADQRLRRRFETVSKLNQEAQRIDALAGPHGATDGFLAQLRLDVVDYRTLVVGEAGGLAQARLLRVLQDLRRHLAGALKITQETLKARRGDSPDSVLQEQAAAAAARLPIEVSDEHIEWPFTGEYWRDELGSYLYDIESLCNIDAEPGDD